MSRSEEKTEEEEEVEVEEVEEVEATAAGGADLIEESKELQSCARHVRPLADAAESISVAMLAADQKGTRRSLWQEACKAKKNRWKKRKWFDVEELESATQVGSAPPLR